MKPLLFIGLPGAGKTMAGGAVAQRLGLDFFDVDQEIERRAGLGIFDFFQAHGEPAFRELEREVVAELVAGADRVVSLGGGAFQDPTTRALALDRGIVIWLDLPHETLLAHVRASPPRPLFAGRDDDQLLRELAAARGPAFAAAHIRVTEASVDAILQALDAWAEGDRP
jgi:shikimate kinase